MIVKANQTITVEMQNNISITRSAKIIPKGRIFTATNISPTGINIKRYHFDNGGTRCYKRKWFDIISK